MSEQEKQLKLPQIESSKDQLRCLIGGCMRVSQSLMYLEHLRDGSVLKESGLSRIDIERVKDTIAEFQSGLKRIDSLARGMAEEMKKQEQTDGVNAILPKPEEAKSRIIIP